ncbi:MAG: MATE family efflux transporter [Croceibacterium sp.]
MSPTSPSLRRSELFATLQLAWPLAAANLLQMLVYAIDVIFLARLGQETLAAASLSISLFGLLTWMFSGLTGMVAALVSAELGRRRHAVREVRRSVRMALWLAFALGFAGMGVCWFGERIMLVTGQQTAIAEAAGRFLRVIMFAMPLMLFSNVLRSFVSALGRPLFATLIAVLAIGVSALANYALVFGRFGLPALGLEGSALASVLTALFTLACYALAVRSDRRLRRYALFGNWWRPEWSRLAELIRTGIPVALTILAEAGLFSGAAFLMGRIGAAQLAGHAIALQVAALAFQVPFGLGQAATIRVGYFYGAGDGRAAGQAGWTAIALGTGFMALTAAIMLFAPRWVLGLYIDPAAPHNAMLVHYATQFLVVAAGFQLFDGLQAVAAGSLRGFQDTRVPMMLALFGYWVPGLGTSIFLGFFTPLAGLGIWFGLAVGLVTVALLLVRRWARRDRLGLLPV